MPYKEPIPYPIKYWLKELPEALKDEPTIKVEQWQGFINVLLVTLPAGTELAMDFRCLRLRTWDFYIHGPKKGFKTKIIMQPGTCSMHISSVRAALSHRAFGIRSTLASAMAAFETNAAYCTIGAGDKGRTAWAYSGVPLDTRNGKNDKLFNVIIARTQNHPAIPTDLKQEIAERAECRDPLMLTWMLHHPELATIKECENDRKNITERIIISIDNTGNNFGWQGYITPADLPLMQALYHQRMKTLGLDSSHMPTPSPAIDIPHTLAQRRTGISPRLGQK